MSAPNSQDSTGSLFDEIFFPFQASAPIEGHEDLFGTELEKKGYNTRGRGKALEQSHKNQVENNGPTTPVFGSFEELFNDIYASPHEEDSKAGEFNLNSLLDDDDDDDVQIPDIPADIQTTFINGSPDLEPQSLTTEENGDTLMPDIEVTTSDQQESPQPKASSNNKNTAIQPKRHSLRKRNDIQLHPYSVEKARYISIIRNKSRTSRDRMYEYIDSSQYAREQDQDDNDPDDPDFVPGQPNIPTQSDSIVQETQESELDPNVLLLPKRRSKPAPALSRTNKKSSNPVASSTNTARNKDDKRKPIFQSLLNEKESTSASSHYLQTDPISSLPSPTNAKGKHRILYTYKGRNHPKPSKKATDHRSIFDFDPEPRASYNPDDDDDDEDDVKSISDTNQGITNLVIDDDGDDDDEEEEMLPLSKKRPKKRKVIISDSDDEDKESDNDDDDDDDDDDDVIMYTRREGLGRKEKKKPLLEPHSITLFEDMVNNSTQAQERPKRMHRRQRSDDDVVPVVQDENELGMRENKRVRLNDITTNNRMLHGILPYSYATTYRSELQEEQQWKQTRKTNPAKRSRVEKERQPEEVKLHTPTDIFSDEEDDDSSTNATSQIQLDHTTSSGYTQSQNLDLSLEAVEDNRMAKHFIREPTTKSQNRSTPRKKAKRRSNQSFTSAGYNKVSNYYQKSRSTGQTSQKRRRRKLRKTTDDFYIRPPRRYWNEETIDSMFIRQGKQSQQNQQKVVSHDDFSIGPSFKPTTTWHKTKITWIQNIENYLRSEKIEHRNTSRAIRELREREERRLSATQHSQHHHHHQQQQQQQQQEQQQHRQQKVQNMTVEEVLKRTEHLVDADLRPIVGIPNSVYIHHQLLPSLLSRARNSEKYFRRFKPLLQHPVFHNTRVSWQDIVSTEQKRIRGWFWKAFYDITKTFQDQELTTIDSTFYIFVSVCIGRYIPSLSGDAQMAMIKIFNTEARIFASQICQFITRNLASGPFIPWKVVIEAMLFTLDWKCRLFKLGAEEFAWPLTDLTSSLIQLLVEIGPERLTMASTSYVTEAWVFLLQIMSVSAESDGYYFDERMFFSQLEKWVDVKASRETWSKSYKTQAMKQWANAFTFVFDKYMI